MDSQEKVVTVKGNHILFYASVDQDKIIELQQQLEDIESDTVYLHIHSTGGEAILGLTVASILANSDKTIYTVCDGWACSAAATMFLAGHERYVRPNSMILLHQVRGEVSGSYMELSDTLTMYELLNTNITQYYIERTKLSRSQVERLLLRDSWFTSENMISMGIADNYVL